MSAILHIAPILAFPRRGRCPIGQRGLALKFFLISVNKKKRENYAKQK